MSKWAKMSFPVRWDKTFIWKILSYLDTKEDATIVIKRPSLILVIGKYNLAFHQHFHLLKKIFFAYGIVLITREVSYIR
jgi:hypothetical protein